MAKVCVNSIYIYNPVGYDLFDPKVSIPAGSKVKVVNQRGCPPANTGGHCFVEFNGKFQGLVLTASLSKL